MNIEEVRKSLKTEVRRANARLQKLQYQLGTRYTWAGKKLYERLSSSRLEGALTERGYIRYSKELTDSQARAILKAVNQFNESKTSTIKGIREVEEQTRKTIERRLTPETAEELPNEYIEDLYNIFTDIDALRFSEENEWSPSELQIIIDEAVKRDSSKEEWFSILQGQSKYMNDVDIRKKANYIYDKYVRPYR